MTDQASLLINEINQMKDQYFAEVGADARRAWPKSIRERVLLLDDMKMNRKELARLTGVPYETIMQWRYQENKNEKRQFHALAVREGKNATVTVASPKVTVPNATVTVTTPTGYRIEGVADEVAKVLKALGRA